MTTMDETQIAAIKKTLEEFNQTLEPFRNALVAIGKPISEAADRFEQEMKVAHARELWMMKVEANPITRLLVADPVNEAIADGARGVRTHD